jgi:colanic acid/amylovoran biosynthesis protein
MGDGENKTILVRTYTNENLGDDLFLKILFEKYPQTDFLLIVSLKKYRKWETVYKNVNTVYFHLNIFERIIMKVASIFESEYGSMYLLKKYNNFFSSLKNRIDAYIYIGGSLFKQRHAGISIEDKLNKMITTILFDKPKYILGANFGPLIEEKYLHYYQSIFEQYTDICFRDHYSYNLFKSLPNVRCETDTVFCININNIKKEEGSIGFSLINLVDRLELCKYSTIYTNTILKLINHFSFGNYRTIYFFSFCKKEGDEEVIKKIFKKLSPSIKRKVKIVKYRGEINTFLFEYMKVEFMFTTRFHAMILSLIANQRIYPFVYSDKMTNILEDLKYGNKYSNINNIKDVDNIIEELNSNDFALIPSIRQSAEKQFDKLTGFIMK